MQGSTGCLLWRHATNDKSPAWVSNLTRSAGIKFCGTPAAQQGGITNKQSRRRPRQCHEAGADSAMDGYPSGTGARKESKEASHPDLGVCQSAILKRSSISRFQIRPCNINTPSTLRAPIWYLLSCGRWPEKRPCNTSHGCTDQAKVEVRDPHSDDLHINAMELPMCLRNASSFSSKAVI